MNPEYEAVIIREHARIRAELMNLKMLYGTDGEYVRLKDVLGLLFILESAKPKRPKIDLSLD